MLLLDNALADVYPITNELASAPPSSHIQNARSVHLEVIAKSDVDVKKNSMR
jgi:hypothetical protein